MIGNIAADPAFVSATDVQLNAGSPCIDAGNATLLRPDRADLDADGNTAEPIPLDLAENPRVSGASVDMGAYESP